MLGVVVSAFNPELGRPRQGDKSSGLHSKTLTQKNHTNYKLSICQLASNWTKLGTQAYQSPLMLEYCVTVAKCPSLSTYMEEKLILAHGYGGFSQSLVIWLCFRPMGGGTSWQQYVMAKLFPSWLDR